MKDLRAFSPVSLNLVLQADVQRDGELLRFAFVLSGAVDKIKIPAFSRPLRRQDELWKTTCFEAFISRPESREYWELNFSPSGAWNGYHFDDYRKGMRPADLESVEIQPRQGIQGYQLHAAARLPEGLSAKDALEISLTAVIEGAENSYWALKHAGKEADFHLRESFTIRLPGLPS